jgi:hypothetical protein
MPAKRPREPIGPTNIPGESLDPKIPPDLASDTEPAPETPAKIVKVTPLDEDKNLEDGIEVKET